MALTRLLQAKQTIRFTRIGYTNSARWYSPSDGEIDKLTSSKRGAAAREKEKAVESYVNKYMQENPGVFPKPSYVHKEVGGSWNTLKNILQNVKEKIFGNTDTQLHEPNPNADSKVTEGPDKIEVHGDNITVSPIMKDNRSGDTSNDTVTKAIHEQQGYLDNLDQNPSVDSIAMNGSNGDKITVLPIVKDTLSGNDVNLTITKAISENDSKSIDSKVSERSKSMTENGCFDNVELSTSSVETKDFVVESKIIAKTLREEVGQENIRSDVSKMTNFTSEEKARPPNFHNNLISKSDKLSSDKPEKDSFVKRLRQIGYANQEDKKTNNISPELSTMFEDVRRSQTTVKRSLFTIDQDTTKTLQELVEMKLTSKEYINNQSSPSKGPPQKESLIQTNDKVTPAIQTNEKVTPACPQEFSVSGEAKSSDLKGLVDCIKVLPIRQEGKIVNNSTQMEHKKSVDTKFSLLNRPNSTHSPPEMTDMENKEGANTNFNTINCPKSMQVPLKNNDTEPSQSQREGQNKVKLVCLPKTTTKMHIYNAFRSSGDLQSVEFIYDKEKIGSGLSADLCFKTVEGMKKALELRHVIIHDQKVTIAESPTTTANTLPIPNLISTALSGLIKNPKRTVVIKQLTPDISYLHLEEAFSFCDSKISAVVLGSSKCVAYVEFKSEEGKNKALAKHSVDVLGKQLLLTRIDAPRTTVVRLSNIADFHQIVQKLKPTYESLGRVATVRVRDKRVLDVYFELNEWPNMLNIVNSLNGMVIGEEILVAAPAPIYPPEILRALWNHPEEKRQVKAVVRDLIRKFGESSRNMVALANTADQLYQD